MEKMIFGAKSKAPANTKLTNGYTLYDWAARQNCFPAFWGRSISGGNKITEEEIEFLKEKDCKIALIFDDLTKYGIAGKNGTPDALRAVEAVKKLGVPEDKEIVILAEIRDDWNVSTNWILTFAAMIEKKGYIPGFIGNTDSSINFNFNRQCSHDAVSELNALFGATKPEITGDAEEWTPYYPSAMTADRISLWQNKTLELNGVEYHEVYAKDRSILNHMWEYEGKEK